VAHALFIAGLRGVRARTASLIACLEPVYGIVFAAILLGETPSLRTIAGGLAVLGAAFYETVTAKEEPH
jgi:drug/metabolite transporter (DMT)-like permease